MDIPAELKRKSVIVAKDYERVDGRLAYKSDAKCLSLGLVQQKEQGQEDASAKVWRLCENKWSCRSEEIPLHQVLDLAILVSRAMLYFREEAYRYPEFHDRDHPQIDRVGLQGDAMTVEVCEANPMIDEDIRSFYEVLARDGELLGERMRVLAGLLEELGYKMPGRDLKSSGTRSR